MNDDTASGVLLAISTLVNAVQEQYEGANVSDLCEDILKVEGLLKDIRHKCGDTRE